MYALANTCRCWSPLLFEAEHCLRCGKDLLAEPEAVGRLDAWEDLWIEIEKTRYRMIENGAFDWAYVEDGLAAAFDELGDLLVHRVLLGVDSVDMAAGVREIERAAT